MVVFDTKGDLFATAKRFLANGESSDWPRSTVGRDKLNPFDTIPRNHPLLVDHSKAMAESLVVRGNEPEQHWNDKAVQVISALNVFVLLRLKGKERSINSVMDIASDQAMLAGIADILQKMGGIPGRMGSQIKLLFDKSGTLTKEGSGVLSTVFRHLSFLDSEMVAKSLEESTFDVREAMEAGIPTFLQIPPEMLDARRGLLRWWISTMVRVAGSGSEEDFEVFFLLDEASALGSLAAVEEALVRGRSAGVRMLLVYQSDSQVRGVQR